MKANSAKIAAARDRLKVLPLVGGLASIPTRAADLGSVLDHIVPQLDRLHLFLHGYEAIPETARREGVLVHLAPRDTPFGSAGKFYGLTAEQEPCLYFCFDDDILYREGHVQRLRNGILRYGGLALVGLHTAWMPIEIPLRYSRQRRRHFVRGLPRDVEADELGAGTVAFYSEALRIDARVWPDPDISDIALAIDAERAGVPRIGLARPRKSVLPIAENQPDSLYRQSLTDESRHNIAGTELMRLMGRFG
jgi:hypothetical protein